MRTTSMTQKQAHEYPAEQAICYWMRAGDHGDL